ncbi:hypothetical protein HJ01_00866 [Flavobacterium frigoris PS1]|uniref:Uncharacterized protein n=1 Tax=Flavobacterium frigoris (strain PS1) TaxID=1086011 RepID=H7FNW8_FLAFP|nr:hypothetical protein HJ01_00866 [Flavobacterium frigoris PS1]
MILNEIWDVVKKTFFNQLIGCRHWADTVFKNKIKPIKSVSK